jgi:hypothetical protein
MRAVTSPTRAGLLTDHHQADLQAPARVVSGATSQPSNHHASSRVRSPQCELPLSATSPARPPVRSRAEQVAAFWSSFLGDDPATRALLVATARAESRRRRGSRAFRTSARENDSSTQLDMEPRCRAFEA